MSSPNASKYIQAAQMCNYIRFDDRYDLWLEYLESGVSGWYPNCI